MSHVSTKQMFDLTGRVAIVTGGAGLLGVMHCEAIAEFGGIPVLWDIREGGQQEALRHLRAEFDSPAHGIVCDITVKAAVEAAVQETMDRFGRIDILINNAALTVKVGAEGMERYFDPFEEYPVGLWEKALATNMTGAFLCSQAVGRIMVQQQRGVILNIASDAGLVGPDHRIYEGITDPYRGRPFNTPIAYSATKAGLINFTRYLATYWAKHGIRVNTLCPGGVYDGHQETFVRNFSFRVPLGRMAQRHEYKGAIVFLVSDASSYMTGSTVVMDGGRTTW